MLLLQDSEGGKFQPASLAFPARTAFLLLQHQWQIPYVVQGLMTLTLLTLAIVFGLSVAALVGGYRKYMLYRTDLVEGFRLRTW